LARIIANRETKKTNKESPKKKSITLATAAVRHGRHQPNPNHNHSPFVFTSGETSKFVSNLFNHYIKETQFSQPLIGWTFLHIYFAT